MYEIKYAPGWDEYFSMLDNSMQIRVYKKIKKLKDGIKGERMKDGLPYLKVNIDQYRITFREFKELGIRRLYFVGDHKEYGRWIGGEMRKML